MIIKILALLDGLGDFIKFRLMPGHYYDLAEVKPLITGVDFEALLADKAFDADWLLKEIGDRGVTAVIPPKYHRKIQRFFDQYI